MSLIIFLLVGLIAGGDRVLDAASFVEPQQIAPRDAALVQRILLGHEEVVSPFAGSGDYNDICNRTAVARVGSHGGNLEEI